MGISILPPEERPVNNLSASSRLSVLRDILDLFSFSFTFPMLVGTSLAIRMFLPMGKAMCIIKFASSSTTGNSGDDNS
jgi:hypothetical protein